MRRKGAARVAYPAVLGAVSLILVYIASVVPTGNWLYTALFGLYPLVKSLIERLRKRGLEYLLKLAFFNASFTLIFLIMRTAVLDSLHTALGTVWVLYLAANAVFLIYDFGFSRLIGFYVARIGRAVR